MNIEGFRQEVINLEEKVKNTETKENSEELKERILETLKLIKYKKITELIPTNLNLNETQEKLLNDALKILEYIKEVIEDGIIDQKDRKLVDKITENFNKLSDRLDKVSEKEESNKFTLSYLKLLNNIRKGKLFGHFEGQLDNNDLKEIFGEKIPNSPEMIVKKLGDYMRKNFQYDFLRLLLSPKVENTEEFESGLKEFINIITMANTLKGKDIPSELKPFIEKFNKYRSIVKNKINQTFTPEDFNKSEALKNLYNFINGNLTDNFDITSTIENLKKDFPKKTEELFNSLSIYDDVNIKDFMYKIKIGVCRDFAGFAKKVFEALENEYPQIDIQLNMGVVVDFTMNHTYNILIYKKGDKIEKKLVDFTPYLGGYSSNIFVNYPYQKHKAYVLF